MVELKKNIVLVGGGGHCISESILSKMEMNLIF